VAVRVILIGGFKADGEAQQDHAGRKHVTRGLHTVGDHRRGVSASPVKIFTRASAPVIAIPAAAMRCPLASESQASLRNSRATA